MQKPLHKKSIYIPIYALRVSSQEPIHASFSKGAFVHSGHRRRNEDKGSKLRGFWKVTFEYKNVLVLILSW